MALGNKVLSADQIKTLDQYTIQNEPIVSIQLMERAAEKFHFEFIDNVNDQYPIAIFAGPGNNGGDALAVGRMLMHLGYTVKIHLLGDRFSVDNQKNQDRLKWISNLIKLKSEEDIPELTPNTVVIDGIFGSGLSKPLEGLYEKVVKYINKSNCKVYSIDVPTGLNCDQANKPEDTIIEAEATYTFHAPKTSFFYSQNGKYVGKLSILDIKLSNYGETFLDTSKFYLEKSKIKSIIKKRGHFSHKGTFGHGLLIAGSKGKIGASLLAAKACLRSGIGLLTTSVTSEGETPMLNNIPEAMHISREIDELEKTLSLFTSIGIGPGIGQEDDAIQLTKTILQSNKPLVIDADALNIIAFNNLHDNIPINSILTPHPGEFKRIVGEYSNDEEKMSMQLAFSKKHKCYLVLKGAYTSISTPNGKIYYNTTGNPGMATAGSGDVLTGIITSLLSQQYSPLEAALIGTYVHGLAGDFAKNKKSEIGLIASDIIEHLGSAFLELS